MTNKLLHNKFSNIYKIQGLWSNFLGCFLLSNKLFVRRTCYLWLLVVSSEWGLFKKKQKKQGEFSLLSYNNIGIKKITHTGDKESLNRCG